MTKKEVNYIWQKQSMASHVDVIDCFFYDPIKDFRRDPSGNYVLIKPDYDHKTIEVAICNKEHQVIAVFKGGKKAQDVYETIFQYEKQHGIEWFKSKGHCAYLGKELKKVEAAIISGQNNYIQE